MSDLKYKCAMDKQKKKDGLKKNKFLIQEEQRNEIFIQNAVSRLS